MAGVVVVVVVVLLLLLLLLVVVVVVVAVSLWKFDIDTQNDGLKKGSSLKHDNFVYPC